MVYIFCHKCWGYFLQSHVQESIKSHRRSGLPCTEVMAKIKEYFCEIFYIIFIFSKKGGKQYKIKLLQRKTTEASLMAYSWNLPSKANVPNVSFRIRRQFEIRKFVYFRLKLPLKMCHRQVGLYIQRNILVFKLGTIVMWKVHYHG